MCYRLANVQNSRLATEATGSLFYDAIHAPTARITIAKANAAAGSTVCLLAGFALRLAGLMVADYRFTEFVSIEILTESFVAVAGSASKHGSQVVTSHGCSGWLHLLQVFALSKLIHKPFDSALTLFGHGPYRIELSRKRADVPGRFANASDRRPLPVIAPACNGSDLPETNPQ